MQKKDYTVEVEVKEITTKTALVGVKSANQTMARGVAEHKIDEGGYAGPWSIPLKTVEVISSRIVPNVPDSDTTTPE